MRLVDAIPVTALVCAMDAVASVRIASSVGTRALVCPCRSMAEVVRGAERVECAAVVHVLAADDGPCMSELSGFQRRFPTIPVLAMAGHAGAATDEPLAIETDDVAVDRVIGIARQRSAAGQLLAIADRVRPDLDGLVRAFIRAAAAAPRSVSTVVSAAAMAGASLRTIEKRVRVEGLPGARELFWRIMVVRAAWILRDPRSTVERVVALLPFANRSAVSKRFQRYAFMTPTEAREEEERMALLARFERSLARMSRP